MIRDTDRRAQLFRAFLPAIDSREASILTRPPEGDPLMDTVETAGSTVQGPAVSSPEIDSVVLQRLIEEVRLSEPVLDAAYNRTYNRHNR